MNFHTRISFKSVGTPNRKTWFVTYDNRVLGDSRGYSTAEEARAEALKVVENSEVINGARRYFYMPGHDAVAEANK